MHITYQLRDGNGQPWGQEYTHYPAHDEQDANDLRHDIVALFDRNAYQSITLSYQDGSQLRYVRKDILTPVLQAALDTLLTSTEHHEAWAMVMGNLNPGWEEGKWTPDEGLFQAMCEYTGLLH
jgi:hypothetical protein